MSLAVTSPLKMISSTSSTPDNTVESPGINHDPNFMLQMQRSTSQSQLNPPPHLMPPPLNSMLNQNNQSMNSQPLSPTNSDSYDSDDSDDSDIPADEDEENRKRRELLLRRPSYKRILEDLEGNNSNPEIKKEPMRDQIDCMENNNENQNQAMIPGLLAQQQDVQMPNMNLLQSAPKYVFPNQTPVQLLTTSAGHDTSINSMISIQNQTSAVRSPYQPLHPGMLSPALFMTPQAITTQQQMAEDAAKKREIRLMKNRIAAKECRRKKKEYVKCLESRVQVLENQNKALIDELRSLKDLYLPKNTDGTSMPPPTRVSNSDSGLKEANDSHQ